tara:strand:+ start:245 stop:628 length:384 start_codon:yes stop_codon:yes gene_type:complete
MFSFIKFSKDKGENIYDIRIPLSEKDNFLKKYSLYFKYREKKYYIKNVVVTLNESGQFYNYEEDGKIFIKDDFIVREFSLKECPYFSFFKSDIEEEYDLYSNEDSSILLKVFKEHFTFEMFKDKNIL